MERDPVDSLSVVVDDRETRGGVLTELSVRWEAVQGALVTVALFIGLPVLRTRSARETAQTLLFAARQGRAVASGALPRRGTRPKGKRGLQLYLLQGLPGIGPARAARLLEHFGSVDAVVTADDEALAAVAGIGRRTARRLRWAVSEPQALYSLAARSGNAFLATGSVR